MRRDDSSPEAYRASVEGGQRELLDALRRAIFVANPGIAETIDYGMLRYPGIGCLAAQKHYVSLYVSPEVLARHAAAFEGVSRGKSCLRFRRLEQFDPAAVGALLDELAAASRSGALQHSQ